MSQAIGQLLKIEVDPTVWRASRFGGKSWWGLRCIDRKGSAALGGNHAKDGDFQAGAEWKTGSCRATFEPDYGRRGKLWVHGAFEPATGQATMLLRERRDSASHIRLLEKMTEAFPSDRWLVVEDNLSIHTSQETKLALVAWPEMQLQLLPRYAPWLNLIEPWWKQLRSLALKGRRFESAEELEEGLFAALAYWNARRRPYLWKKRPQEQVLLQHVRLGGYGVSQNAHA